MASVTEFELLPLLQLLQLANPKIATSESGAAGNDPSPQLQAFLDAIPFANDGDVITPDHHNTLRTALGQIARALDETQFARVVTLSLLPALKAAIGQGEWQLGEGYAQGPAEGTKATGWMALELPSGAQIDTLVVRGTIPEKPTAWTAAIRRKGLDETPGEDVILGQLHTRLTAAGAFSESFSAPPSELTPTQAAERRRVDNSRYRYLFSTTLSSPQANKVLLSLVQITCVR